MYEPFHQMEVWGENLKSTDEPVARAALIVGVDTKLDNQVMHFILYAFGLISFLVLGSRICYSAIFFIYFFLIFGPSQRIHHTGHWVLLTVMIKERVDLLTR